MIEEIGCGPHVWQVAVEAAKSNQPFPRVRWGKFHWPMRLRTATIRKYVPPYFGTATDKAC